MANSNKKAVAIGMILGFGILLCLFIAFLGYRVISSGYLSLDEIFDLVGNLDGNEGEENGASAPSEAIPSPSSPVGNGKFEFDQCPFPGNYVGVECGYLTVPENRRAPNSPSIELAVAVVKSENDGAQIPLIYLEGGPGGSALDGVELWLDTPIGFDRDIILIDQRGTGYSKPTLNCSEYDDEEAYDYYYEYGYDFELLEDCRDRLIAEGTDLGLYNSAESAADIADLRIAMGYQQVDLFGISYGTRLALTVMRDYPEGIRSVILDSVYPPHVNALEEQSLITVQVFETLFRGCEVDPECNQAYPNLEAVFYELLTDFYDYPAEFTYYDEYYGEWVDEVLYGDDIAYILFDSMYDSSVIPYLPAFLYALHNEDYEYAYEILDKPFAGYYEEGYSEVYEDVSDSEGMFYAVECREEVYFNDVDTAENLVDNYSYVITDGLLWEVYDFFESCDVWSINPASSIENMPVTSDIPTLVLAGEYDPITPPSWAQSTASHLENSQFFIFLGYGHAVIDGGSCPVDILLDFLSDPFSQVDDSCLANVGPPDFVVNP